MNARPAACAAAVLLAVSLVGCVPEPEPTPSATPTTTVTVTATPTATPTATVEPSAATQYCTEKGGTVVEFTPSADGGAADWVRIADPVAVCRFQQGSGDTATDLEVDLGTLSAEEPTMAAYAYLSRKPLPGGGGGDNPAAQLCANLDGASLALTPVGGPADAAVTACRFADGSFIDEWAIAYYSGGDIRGADLAPLFRFDPAQVPAG